MGTFGEGDGGQEDNLFQFSISLIKFSTQCRILSSASYTVTDCKCFWLKQQVFAALNSQCLHERKK